MAAEYKFQNFPKFLKLSKSGKLRMIGVLPAHEATWLTNDYHLHHESGGTIEIDVWAKMLEVAAPDVFSETSQPSWLRDRIAAARLGGDAAAAMLAAADDGIKDGKEVWERESQFSEGCDEEEIDDDF